MLGTLNELDAAAVPLVQHQQAIGTTTPARRMFIQVTGAFAEFERGMIRRALAPWPARDREQHRCQKRSRGCALRDGEGVRVGVATDT